MPYNKKVTKEIRRAVEEELKAGVPIKSLLEKYPVAKLKVEQKTAFKEGNYTIV